MKRSITIIAALSAILVLSGCSAIENMLNGLTRQTITASRTIADTTDQTVVQTANFAPAMTVIGDQPTPVGVANLYSLAESMEIFTEGLANVQFFVLGHFHNLSDQPAVLSLLASPNVDGSTPALLASLTLQPGEDIIIDSPGQMDQSATAVSQNIQSVLRQVNDQYAITPSVQAQGAGDCGVEMDSVQIATQSVYYETRTFTPGNLSEYQQDVVNVQNGTLVGTVTNTGTQSAELNLYIMNDATPSDPLGSQVAHVVLGPGEVVDAQQIMTDIGGAQISSAFQTLIDGQSITGAMVIVSDDPLSLIFSNLSIQVPLVVEAKIF